MKEKILIIVLAIIFVLVLGGMVWDLYGKNMLTKKDITSTVPAQTESVATDSARPKQKNGEKPNNKQVDPTLYAKCTPLLNTQKAYKDCCDGLSDDLIKKACKKIVDGDLPKGGE